MHNQILVCATKSWKEYVIPSTHISCQTTITTPLIVAIFTKKTQDYIKIMLEYIVGNAGIFLT